MYAEDWRRSTAITLDSAYYVLRAAIPAMKANGGSITTIAGRLVVAGFPSARLTARPWVA